jgi:copper(I)-binding protein
MFTPMLQAGLSSALLLAALITAQPALAQTTVTDAWVRATVAGQTATGAFMTLTATGDSKLVEVKSAAATDVQIHQSTMKDDVMRMGQVSAVTLPAGTPVALESGGYHVMLMGLGGQVKEGDQVPLTLVVEDAKGARETIEVQAPARALASGHVHGAVH